MTSFETWWHELGPMTKFSLLTPVALGIAVMQNVVISDTMAVDLYESTIHLQVWRFITGTYLLGKPSFPWLMAVAMLVIYVRYNEDFDFKGRLADMIWMKVLLIVMLQIMGTLFGVTFVGSSLTMSLCWIFCKRHPEMQMTLYFFSFSANIFPWVLLAFQAVLGGSIVPGCLGIVAGHVYLFLADVLPKTHGKHWAKTPSLLYTYVPNQQVAMAGVHMPTRLREQQQADQGGQRPQRHNWGAGRALGTN